MFDITGEDIASLTDADIRTLVARLAVAELSARGAPLSSVTAGGSQDAADGGIDVRVDLATSHLNPDFVPRAKTGFQVKKPDLAAQGIRGEMRPNGVLRPSIAALADAGGAYIIASAGASLTDTALARRRDTMRAIVDDHQNGHALHVDFYDRDRLANWVNQSPGVAAWVRRRSGRPLSGWKAIGMWRDLSIANDKGYLIDDGLSLIDEKSSGARSLPIGEGMGLLRETLNQGGECVRLIGLSGVGKTRFVEALFESNVGKGFPLDPSLSVYTDYADDTTPSAREMASRLKEDGQRAILIVDNCNPSTHAQLAEICGQDGSRVSLLTIEYDIREDEPEDTQVFRLSSASEEVIATWLERDFPHVTQPDRRRIAIFSGGNFRLARALANTVLQGETLGQLRDQDLFERVFIQRNGPDRTLLKDAELVSLFYSFDVSEGEGGELDQIARFAGRTVADIYGSIAELQARGVLQARGRWRAVLPHAIANRLAAGALRRMPPLAFDKFCRSLPERMRRSMSRRLGFLHDVSEARDVVVRWLVPTGPVGDLLTEPGLSMLTNIAPVHPEAVLERIETAFTTSAVEALTDGNLRRGAWVPLLKALAYEEALFPRAARLLAQLVASEGPDEKFNSAKSAFGELFQLYLSGTLATPSVRRSIVRDLLSSPLPGLRQAGHVALDRLFISGHFSATSITDFGARPRSYGWTPPNSKAISEWYEEAIELLCSGLVSEIDVRKQLAGSIRGLWRYSSCRSRFTAAARDFAGKDGWLEGWAALCSMMQFDGAEMPSDARTDAVSAIALLAPNDIVTQARAWVLPIKPGAWDVAELEDEDEAAPLKGWRRAEQKAREIGRAMIKNPNALRVFLPEALAFNDQGDRRSSFGAGMGEGANDLHLAWAWLCSAFADLDPGARNPTVLGHFLRAATERDPSFVAGCLDAAVEDQNLSRHFAFLQVVAGIDEFGVIRTIRAINASGKLDDFWHLSYVNVEALLPKFIAKLIDAILEFPNGSSLAIEILWHYFWRIEEEDVAFPDPLLVEQARRALTLIDLDASNAFRDASAEKVASAVLGGEEGRATALAVSQRLHAALTADDGWRLDAQGLIAELFSSQPEIALDTFIDGPEGPVRRVFSRTERRGSPLEMVEADRLTSWANLAPERRYAQLGSVLSLFKFDKMDDVVGLNPLFTTILESAPNKSDFLGDDIYRVHPRSWSGSLADILESRKALLGQMPDHPDVISWREREYPRIDEWIASVRDQESREEERFE